MAARPRVADYRSQMVSDPHSDCCITQEEKKYLVEEDCIPAQDCLQLELQVQISFSHLCPLSCQRLLVFSISSPPLHDEIAGKESVGDVPYLSYRPSPSPA